MPAHCTLSHLICLSNCLLLLQEMSVVHAKSFILFFISVFAYFSCCQIWICFDSLLFVALTDKKVKNEKKWKQLHCTRTLILPCTVGVCMDINAWEWLPALWPKRLLHSVFDVSAISANNNRKHTQWALNWQKHLAQRLSSEGEQAVVAN